MLEKSKIAFSLRSSKNLENPWLTFSMPSCEISWETWFNRRLLVKGVDGCLNWSSCKTNFSLRSPKLTPLFRGNIGNSIFGPRNSVTLKLRALLLPTAGGRDTKVLWDYFMTRTITPSVCHQEIEKNLYLCDDREIRHGDHNTMPNFLRAVVNII